MRALRQKSYDKTGSYQKVKERARTRSAIITLAGQDIAPMPAPVDLARRAKADEDFKFFCETYFPHLFSLSWSGDHLRVIAKIERVVKHFDTLAIAMPRGSGKTTLCLAAVIWAILSGRHKFVYLLASTDSAAMSLLENLKNQLSSNEYLLADYPEAMYPIKCLEGEARRCNGQRFYGIPTRIGWGVDEITMPSIPNSPCAGAIIRVSGLTGNFRGALHVREDGRSVRPSLVVCDDPQTDASARSAVQTAERLGIINGAVVGLAGPAQRTAIIIPCTVIQQGDLADQLLDRNRYPAWRGERTKLVYSFPANQKLWNEYQRIRDASLRADGDGHEASEFYRFHREAMDEGAVVAWPARYAPHKGEISAIQHAMNLRFDHGEAMFASEYQNEPLIASDMAEALTIEQFSSKASGRPKGEVSIEAAKLTAFIDVHDQLLFWAVCAWEDNFTGYVVDYGTFPEQNKSYFTLQNIKKTLGTTYPKAGIDGAIQEGLSTLVSGLLARNFKRGQGLIRIDRLLVDMGYKPEIVAAVKFKVGGSTMMLYKGKGITAGSKPIATYMRKPGWTIGHNWYIPSVARTQEFPHVSADVNYWKAFIHNGFRATAGDGGSITIFGSRHQHDLLGDHVVNAETWTLTHGQGRDVREWKLKPNKPDNHWFDCLVGCAVAASMLGAKMAGHEGAVKPRKEAIKLSTLQKARI
jgi:hypothetical protein